MNDAYMRSNLISTVSNLLRYSSIFLSQLIKTGLIGNILKIACESQVEQSVAGLIMSLIKKMLPYDEFYQAFGVKELKNIYQRRQLFGGDNNETIKKIREVLISRGEFNWYCVCFNASQIFFWWIVSIVKKVERRNTKNKFFNSVNSE